MHTPEHKAKISASLKRSWANGSRQSEGRRLPPARSRRADGSRLIPLTQGQVAIVDHEDYERLVNHKWFTYANGGSWSVVRKLRYKKIRMHNEIMPPPAGFVVDHINGNALDNRRTNLRLCTPRENWLNRRKRRGCKVPYIGVTRNGNGFTARICPKVGHRIYIGHFHRANEAADAYNSAAKEYHGDFAKLNEV